MAIILNLFKWYMSVEYLHKGINIFSSVYAAFEIYIHILFWYHLQFKWYCIYKKRISNCVVTIYSCINLVHILYKQAGTNFLHLKALALYERGKVIHQFLITDKQLGYYDYSTVEVFFLTNNFGNDNIFFQEF